MPHAVPAFAQFPAGTLIFYAAYGTWAAAEAWIFARDRKKVAGRREDRGSLYLLVASIVGAIILAFAAASIGRTAIALPPQALVLVGVVWMWTGIAFRLWAVRTLGRFFRVSVTTHDDHRLVGHGPYARLRNPAYTGAMLTLAGLGLAIGNWLSLAATILLPLAGFIHRIRVEEASLALRFGAEWQAFRSRRWALLPPIW